MTYPQDDGTWPPAMPIPLVWREVLGWPWPKQPHTCPVCKGKGQVNAGFYNTSGHSLSGGTAEQCRTCKGSGIVWQP